MNTLKFAAADKIPASYQNAVPAPVFHKDFELTECVDGHLLIGTTGLYEIYLDGERITRGRLSPYISNPRHLVYFEEYPMALSAGAHTLDILLGNGFANPIGGSIWGHTKLCQPPALALRFTAGDVTFTADDMRWRRSPILFDDLRVGTLCDRTADPGPWHEPIACEQPAGERRMVSCEPVREVRTLRAKKISPGVLRDYRMRDGFTKNHYNGETVIGTSPLCGGFLYDFGENCAGVPRLKICGERGQRVEMTFCELLFEGFADSINIDCYPEGCCQRDVYICGGGEEEYIPPFTYHGARYCYVTGITQEQATDALIEWIVMRNDVPEISQFACSDEISNEIFAACRRSDESNLFYIITDCPTREKNGWTGDAAISAAHYLYDLGISNVAAEWLRSIRKTQWKDGKLDQVVPSSGTGGASSVWDSVIFFLPYAVWKHTGDTGIIAENADAFLKNLEFYMNLRDARGIVEIGYGDWLPEGKLPDEYASPLGFCCSVVLMECCRMAEKMFNAIGRGEDARLCRTRYRELREAVRAEYLEGGVIGIGRCEKYRRPLYRPCQTSQALGILWGVFDEEELPAAMDALLCMISENGGAFDCGFLGMRTIFRALSDHGNADLAYKMITRPAYPSYANMIYRGETTVWERFQPPGYRIGSHNHHFMGDVLAWYIEYAAGIRVNPEDSDPDCVVISPCFIAALDWASASVKTPHGEVFVRWERCGGGIRLNVRRTGDVKIAYRLTADCELTEETL